MFKKNYCYLMKSVKSPEVADPDNDVTVGLGVGVLDLREFQNAWASSASTRHVGRLHDLEILRPIKSPHVILLRTQHSDTCHLTARSATVSPWIGVCLVLVDFCSVVVDIR